MTASSTETAVQRRLTARFIAADSTAVALTRTTAQRTPSGGVKRTNPQVLATQSMHIIDAPSGAVARTLDGLTYTPDLYVLALYDADVQAGDTFVLGGIKHEVMYVHQNRNYETRLEVLRRG